MKDFDEIKDMWQQQPPAEKKTVLPAAGNKMPAGIKAKLLLQQSTAVVVLACIALLLVWLGFYSGSFFKRTITYIGLAMAFMVIVLQGCILLYRICIHKRPISPVKTLLT